ncbi:MAG: hypothetical protein ACF8MF_11450 [Phycisphaerales bacterium JB052]
MKKMNRIVAISSLIAIAGNASARLIIEDFLDDMGGAAFDAELEYSFQGGSWDLLPGELNLWPETVDISVNSLTAGEYIESVEVQWTDFCGIGCTSIEVFGATSTATQFNAAVGSSETWTLSTGDIGEEILGFSLSSFEGRFDRITINVVPAPASIVVLMGGLVTVRRRR